MLIKTISFDIHNFRDDTTESFLILDTIDNQEFVFTHKYTRNIQFGKTFDIQLENDMRMPVEMISDSVWLSLLPEMEKEMTESEIELTDVEIEKECCNGCDECHVSETGMCANHKAQNELIIRMNRYAESLKREKAN